MALFTNVRHSKRSLLVAASFAIGILAPALAFADRPQPQPTPQVRGRRALDAGIRPEHLDVLPPTISYRKGAPAPDFYVLQERNVPIVWITGIALFGAGYATHLTLAITESFEPVLWPTPAIPCFGPLALIGTNANWDNIGQGGLWVMAMGLQLTGCVLVPFGLVPRKKWVREDLAVTSVPTADKRPSLGVAVRF